MHYTKLFLRCALFIAATVVYIINRVNNTGETFSGFEDNYILTGTIWLFFAAEMVLRFFPDKIESMGCQKQFARNYRPRPRENPEQRPKMQPGIVTFAVFAAWVALNAVFGVLYYAKVIDKGVLLLIALLYSVCDVICILFFCPFQTWFMKNKCCTTCRIYNWDYAMMFTPLIYIPNVYTWSLLGLALILLFKWEYLYRRYPERFIEECNYSLSCANCTEKLCHHKKQLRHFLKNGRFNLVGNSIIKKIKRDK